MPLVHIPMAAWAFFVELTGRTPVTHGTASLALYDDYIRDKNQFGKLPKDKLETNMLVGLSAAAASEPLDFQRADRMYSPKAKSVPVLHRRDAVFIGCHNCHGAS